MTDPAQRIAQFEHMAQADPENEMAHFSLGSAYAATQRYEEAAASYERCTQLVPSMSKAYQLAAEMYAQIKNAAKAGQLAREGYIIAAEQGDRMPAEAMKALLEKLNLDIPEVKQAAQAAGPGRGATKMQHPPFKGPVGQWIMENVSQEMFNEWIGQGTKVINELRLDLSRDEDAATYDQHMHEYLGVPPNIVEQLRK